VDDVVPFPACRCRPTFSPTRAWRRFADRFVWLAADTEKAQNAALTVRYPSTPIPVSSSSIPNDDSVSARKIGS